MRWIALLLISSLAVAQAPPPAAKPADDVKPQDKCSLEGHVVNGATGEPLRKVSVSAHKMQTADNSPGFGTVTDAAGNFAMPGLDPGRYLLRAGRNGFVNQQYGARRPGRGGTLLTLAPGQKMTELLFKLTPHSIVTGRVVDADAEPIAGAQIRLMQQQYARGKRELQNAGFAQTNDLGEYRIYGVAPGRYFLNVAYADQSMNIIDKSPPGTQQEGYLPMYYPGVADASAAAPLDVPPGGELRGINLVLQPAKAVRVRGKVTGVPAGQYAMVMAIPRTPASFGFVNPQMSMANQKDGSFEIKGVTAGSYYLTSMAWGNSKERLMARVPLEVGREDVNGVNLALSPGNSITGVVKVEGGKLDPTTLRISVSPTELNSIGGGFASTAPKADGTFTWEAMSPENVTVRVSGLKPGAYVKAIRAGDRDFIDQVDLAAAANGLEIVVSLNGATVEGAVKSGGPKPPAGATVVLAPDAEHAALESWYHSSSTDQDGHYKLESVRPGKYTLYAFEDVEPGAYMEPGFLKNFSKYAVEVELAEKAHAAPQPELIPASAMDAAP